MKEEKKGPHSKAEKPDKENSPGNGHTSHGHKTGAEGADTGNVEPTLRSATTDSSRVAKNSNDDLPEGGNIR